MSRMQIHKSNTTSPTQLREYLRVRIWNQTKDLAVKNQTKASTMVENRGGPCCFEYGRGKSIVRSSQWCYVELRFYLRDGDAFGFEEDLSDRGFELRLKFHLAESEVEAYVSERVKQMNLGHTHKGTLVFTLPDLISVCPQDP